MAFCTNCGNQVPDGVKFCTSCGAPVTGGVEQPVQQSQPVQATPQSVSQTASQPVPQPQPAPQPQSQQVYVAQPQQFVRQPETIYTEEPITTGGYVGIFLLLMLPLINFVCLIIWACGGCRKMSKRNMARAMLIWMIIGAVLSGIFILIFTLFFGAELDSLKDLATDLSE